jgi:hypothetical protein
MNRKKRHNTDHEFSRTAGQKARKNPVKISTETLTFTLLGSTTHR